jgi:hypothetical protein
MQGYQQFAVYSLRDKQPVFTDGSESQVLRTVDRNTRLNVVRREGAHYMVRVLNQIAFVPVDDVSSDRSGQPVAKFGDWTATELKDAPGAAYSGGGSSGANYAGYGFEPADFTTRFLGYLIDWVLSFIAGFIVGVLFLFAFAPSSEAEEPSAALTFGLYAVTFAVSFSYFWFMDAIGGTVGKMVMSVHVIDDATQAARCRQGVRAQSRAPRERHRLLPRLPLDALGQREKDLARQGRRHLGGEVPLTPGAFRADAHPVATSQCTRLCPLSPVTYHLYPPSACSR